MARGLEVDWVVIRVNTVRRLLAVVGTLVVTASLIAFAYMQINVPPETKAQQLIEEAVEARNKVEEAEKQDHWASDIEKGDTLLASARESFANEQWQDAINDASSALALFQGLLGGDWPLGTARIMSSEGRVRVQRAGTETWIDAAEHMTVFNGDLVQSENGTAEIMFNDGTVYRIAEHSQIEIHQRRRGAGSTGGGRVKSGTINIHTSGSTSTITTASTETEVESDSRVAVNVEEDEGATFTAFSGKATIKTTQGKQMVVANREQVGATAAGDLTEKKTIPDPPTPLEPRNNRIFDLDRHPIIELKWRAKDAVEVVYLQVSRSKNFFDRVDIDGPVPRHNGARLQAKAQGTYYWRLAAGTREKRESEWSSAERFQILASGLSTVPEDKVPPALVITGIQELGHLFIVEGKTEVGARVSINGEEVDVETSGQFRKTIELTQEGVQELKVTAVDPAGNQQTVSRKVRVEL